jgi:hypothetical protein
LSTGAKAAVVLVGLSIGLVVAGRHEILSILGDSRTAPSVSAGGGTRALLRVRQLRILNPDDSVGLYVGESGEGSPGIRITNPRQTAIVEAGVRGNGYPFVLVSDGAIRNFGLGRVDGALASPILVFRSDDIVRMVFGLSMTDKGQPPFLVQYTTDGRKHDVVGHYCGRPDRVCAR